MTRRFARSAKKEQPVSSLREGLPSALRFLLFCTLLLLFFSGILQLPIAARCGLTHLGAWFGDFPLLHLVHYSAAGYALWTSLLYWVRVPSLPFSSCTSSAFCVGDLDGLPFGAEEQWDVLLFPIFDYPA